MAYTDQQWVKNNKEYREEFPSMGKVKRTPQQVIEKKSKKDFPDLENAFGFGNTSKNAKKKPVKYSDFQS